MDDTKMTQNDFESQDEIGYIKEIDLQNNTLLAHWIKEELQELDEELNKIMRS